MPEPGKHVAPLWTQRHGTLDPPNAAGRCARGAAPFESSRWLMKTLCRALAESGCMRPSVSKASGMNLRSCLSQIFSYGADVVVVEAIVG